MEFRHIPVLLSESVENLNVHKDGIYVDGTLGGAGHGEEICKRLGENGLFIGIDRDAMALTAASKRLESYHCQKLLVKSNYADIKHVLDQHNIEMIDGAILDLGVSSYQLDTPERGFSYMHDAPLDMRMDREQKFSAYEVVNQYSEQQLASIIKRYGEEKWARRIAKFIAEGRSNRPIETTGQLVDLIKTAIPAAARREGHHPAKRTFQAIRIEVNDELTGLETTIEDFLDVLAPMGRLCIITFHSLEDRMVKEQYKKRETPCMCPPEFPVCVCGKVGDIRRITKKPIVAIEEELEHNPRSRSAKLRVAEKKERRK